MKPDNKTGGPWLYALGLIPAVWLALLIAPSLSGGLSEILEALPAAMNHPFQIAWCEDSVKTVLIFIAAYGLGIGIYLSSRRNYRRGEEHGSAKWGDPRAVNRKYRDKNPFQNRIFTQHVRMGLDGKKHRRTLNTLVCGGSGAGKSRFYAKVNICQANTSFFILDCKGELLRDCGGLLERQGYEIKVVDLLNMNKSHCYNPFAYLKNDNDVQKMVTNLFKATTPKGSQSNDPFWDTAASMLLMALVFYLHYEAPEDEKNFPMVMEMLRAGEVREDDDSYQSPLDELFERLEMRSPDHIAVKYYKDYRSGSAKTLKSIQITLASRLEKFNLSSVAALTATDELELASLGAQVLHNRSVEMAKRYNVNMEVLSSFSGKPGTKVKEVVKTMEKTHVSGVAKDKNVARLALVGLADEPGIAFKIFSLLAKKKINVDIILQSIGRNSSKDISFTVARSDAEEARAILEENRDYIGFQSIEVNTQVAKVSIVGAGMVNNSGVACKMFEALSSAGINISMISTSEIKVSVLVDERDADRAVQAIHDRFFSEFGNS